MIDSLPAGQTGATVRQAVLTDQAGGIWVYSATGVMPYTNGRDFYDSGTGAHPDGLPLSYDPNTGTFSFPPYRDEAGASLTLRLIFNDGSQAVARFAGMTSDLNLRDTPAGASSRTVHTPTELTRAIADKIGNIHLVANAGTVQARVMDNK